MQRKLRLALAIILLLSLSFPLYATAPKAGSKCTKAGTTTTAAGKKYTCIKSGKNLVWDKGVVIPVVVKTPITPVVVKTPAPEVKNLLSSDPRITPTSGLTNIDTCKTTDNTPMQIFSGTIFTNGFPRPAQALTGKKLAKILVIPISFKNLPFTVEKTQRGQTFTSDIEAMNQVIPLVEDLFKTISVGRFEVKIDILPQSDWWVINEDHSFTDASGVGTSKVPKIAEIIRKYKPEFKFDGYDAYVFAGGNGPANMRGLGNAEAAFAYPIANSKNGYFSGMISIGGFTDPALWVHELGHALFELEDLYRFDNPTELPSGKGATLPFLWDVMAESTKRHFLAWNLLLMGWLQDSEMRCLTNQKTSVHYLAEFGATYPTLLTINLAPGVTLAAEARNSTNSEKGLLLYTIDSYIGHGEGPIISQNTLLTKGKSQSWLGWEFTVLDTNTDGVLVSVTKTDIDKYVPPVVKPAVQNQPSEPQSAITVRKAEILPNGSLKGRATLEVSGYESYRVYVTAMDDFQNVYFETGIVNDSRNPLVVDISGLVCNKELRTVIELFSKKNGEGEQKVIAGRELSNLPCP